MCQCVLWVVSRNLHCVCSILLEYHSCMLNKSEENGKKLCVLSVVTFDRKTSLCKSLFIHADCALLLLALFYFCSFSYQIFLISFFFWLKLILCGIHSEIRLFEAYYMYFTNWILCDYLYLFFKIENCQIFRIRAQYLL